MHELTELKNIVLQTITEAKPSAGLSKPEKSHIEKEARAGEDVGHGHFGEVEKKIESEGYSKQAAQKIAASAMWKHAAR